MKQYVFLLSLFSGFISPVKAQENRNYFRVHTAPLSTVDVYNGPNINLSAEWLVKYHWSTLTTISGYLETYPFLTGLQWQHLHGFGLTNETRLFFNETHNHEEFTAFFGSLEVSYGNQEYDRSDSLYLPQGTSYKTYSNHRQFIGITLNAGFNRQFASRLNLTFYFGLGMRYNYLVNTLTQQESDSRSLGDWTVPHNWIQQKGTHWIPKINFGFKIGYAFSTKK